MSRDLETLLRDTAMEPVQPVAPEELIGRARQRRRRRRLGVGAGTVVAAVLAAVAVVFTFDPGGPQRPEIVDQPPEEETSEDETAEPAPDRDPDDSEEDGLPGDPEDTGDPDADHGPATVDVTEVDRSLLVSGADGIRRIDAGQEQLIWDGPVMTALPDLADGVVLQEPGADDPDARGAIRWLPTDTDTPVEPAIAAADQQPVLHTVVEFEGEPTVLFTLRSGQGEDELETLQAYGLDSGTSRELGVTGGLESQLGGAGIVGDRLVLSRCHLQCQLVVVPPGTQPDGDDVTELLPGPMPIEGLDVEDGIAAYVELPVPPGVELEDADAPVLWLHDLDADDRREIPLPADPALDGMAVRVDLWPDGNAALLTFYRWDDPTQARTLLIDRLDDQPRHRRLDTDDHLRFDNG